VYEEGTRYYGQHEDVVYVPLIEWMCGIGRRSTLVESSSHDGGAGLKLDKRKKKNSFIDAMACLLERDSSIGAV
jgi:hypothetical protein